MSIWGHCLPLAHPPCCVWCVCACVCLLLLLLLPTQGGLGKTVIAQQLFNQLAGTFQHTAFIRVDAQAENQQLPSLLEDALCQLGYNSRNSSFIGVSAVADVLKAFVKHNQVLLVLDNIWTKEQLDVLLPTELGRGSRVIVTSRKACHEFHLVGTAL